MNKKSVVLITGTSKGIGRFLAEHYVRAGFQVVGCSRGPADLRMEGYEHHELDVADEKAVLRLFSKIRRSHGGLTHLINNAGIASMNHSLTTPMSSVDRIMAVNFSGTFLFCREGAKLMSLKRFGRIVNFLSVAAPLAVEGEAVYASSKAAVGTLTEILARELAPFGITVNAIGPTPIETGLIRGVPAQKVRRIVERQAIKRLGRFEDVANVVDFFFKPESEFISGQRIFLGGVV